MSTFVTVNTYAYSVAYITDKMMSSLKGIIRRIGLSPTRFSNSWTTLESGVKTWLSGRHFTGITLEVFKPLSNKLVTRWDFTIDYGYSTGDEGHLWLDADAIRFAICKCGVIPSTCEYRVIVFTKPGSPDLNGWSTCSCLSTDGFVRHSLGTTIGASHLWASTSYWRRNR